VSKLHDDRLPHRLGRKTLLELLVIHE
jgi:hypothetical protein